MSLDPGQNITSFIVYVQTGIFVYRVRVMLEPSCLAELALLKVNGVCEPCSKFSEADVEAFSPELQALHKGQCLAEEVSSSSVILYMLGVVFLALVTFALCVYRYRKKADLAGLAQAQLIFFTSVKVAVECSDIITDVIVCNNALSGASTVLAQYKMEYLILTLTGVSMSTLAIVIKLYLVCAKVAKKEIAKEEYNKEEVEHDPKKKRLRELSSSIFINVDRPDDSAKLPVEIRQAQLALVSAIFEDLPMTILNYFVIFNNDMGEDKIVFVSLGISLIMLGDKLNAGNRLRKLVGYQEEN